MLGTKKKRVWRQNPYNVTKVARKVFILFVSKVRLAGGLSQWEGAVEMYHDGAWRTIHDGTIWDAQVACRELGFSGAAEARHGEQSGARSRGYECLQVLCKGQEETVSDCRMYPQSCRYGRTLHVRCGKRLSSSLRFNM